ncbi:hypothetical protein JZ751_024494 [Albula glossodonta]|uniref:Uncharacterized protein n=1 Tax=Albula glossodonta TaxID=121402 RepID=A0A8T2PDJ2_9TELE|nr:hypothetical protein JZ751_024494 [Albula glossodonta]
MSFTVLQGNHDPHAECTVHQTSSSPHFHCDDVVMMQKTGSAEEQPHAWATKLPWVSRAKWRASLPENARKGKRAISMRRDSADCMFVEEGWECSEQWCHVGDVLRGLISSGWNSPAGPFAASSVLCVTMKHRDPSALPPSLLLLDEKPTNAIIGLSIDAVKRLFLCAHRFWCGPFICAGLGREFCEAGEKLLSSAMYTLELSVFSHYTLSHCSDTHPIPLPLTHPLASWECHDEITLSAGAYMRRIPPQWHCDEGALAGPVARVQTGRLIQRDEKKADSDGSASLSQDPERVSPPDSKPQKKEKNWRNK